MTTPTCVRCERPTVDGYGCVPCAVDRPRGHLAEIAETAPAARDVAHSLGSHPDGGGASGKPGSRLPLSLGAMARLDGVQTALSGWARHIGEIRGVEIPRPAAVRPVSGPTCAHPYSCDHGSCRAAREPHRPVDEIEHVAGWLAGHCEWMRHRPEVDEWLTDIEAAARVVRSVARGPREQRYLGPCGAVDPILAFSPTGEVVAVGAPVCDGDVYGPAGGQTGTCRTCGAQVEQQARREWLDEQVAEHAYRAAHIADAYRINVKTIRGWADRGHLLEHGQDRLGRPLYLVGDVLALARQAADRRAANEAKRNREGVAA